MIRSTLFLLLALFMFSTASYACGGGGCCGKKEKRCKHRDHHYDDNNWKSKKSDCCSEKRYTNVEDGFHNDVSKHDDCHGAWFPEHSCDFCYKGPAHDARFWDEHHGCAFDHPCDKDHDHHSRSYAAKY